MKENKGGNSRIFALVIIVIVIAVVVFILFKNSKSDPTVGANPENKILTCRALRRRRSRESATLPTAIIGLTALPISRKFFVFALSFKL